MTEFDRTVISNLPKSLGWFVRSLNLACNTMMRGVKFSDKPEYIKKTEAFTEVIIEGIALKDKVKLENFRTRVLKPIYEQNYTEIISKVIPSEGKVDDKFMKEGLEIKVGSNVLPVSEIYTNITKRIKDKNLRSIHPPKILLGFFAVMFYTMKEEESEENKETLDMISDNMDSMINSIEDILRPPSPTGGGMMDMIKNFNPGKMSEMFNKMGQDPRMSEEFKKAHGKVAEILKSDNPSEVMGELFKEMSAHASASQEENPQMSGPPSKEESSEEVPVSNPSPSKNTGEDVDQCAEDQD
jgi:hypothetical protein